MKATTRHEEWKALARKATGNVERLEALRDALRQAHPSERKAVIRAFAEAAKEGGAR